MDDSFSIGDIVRTITGGRIMRVVNIGTVYEYDDDADGESTTCHTVHKEDLPERAFSTDTVSTEWHIGNFRCTGNFDPRVLKIAYRPID